MPSTQAFTGVIGSGLIGTDPFHPRAWSGIAPRFFGEAKNQDLLQSALGGDVTGWKSRALMLKNFHPNKQHWRLNYYFDPAYRRALSRTLAERILSEEHSRVILQIGGLFDLQPHFDASYRFASYHDGNLALRLSSPFGRLILSQKREKQAWAAEKNLYDSLNHIFVMSEYLRQSFIHDFGQSEAKVHCIGAGVNLDSIPEPLAQKNYDSKELLFIGIDFERKGGFQLLRAFKRLRERYPMAKLHVVGPKSPPPTDMEGVVWHGFLNKGDPKKRRDLEQLFEASSLFLLPSLYEPYGIAPAEAMIHSIPCIVTGAWALGETVQDQVTGWHWELQNEEHLLHLMEDALSDPERLQRYGAASRERALSEFTWARVVQKLAHQLFE